MAAKTYKNLIAQHKWSVHFHPEFIKHVYHVRPNIHEELSHQIIKEHDVFSVL